jgi:uncharacterized protein (DUF2235 family)
MARKLIICCDGTANQFAKDRTNVLKLAYAAVKSQDQLLYYHPGVGTMAPPGLFTKIGKRTVEILGLAFGYGLKADVRDAYTFIMDHYVPGDDIYIFGFSRGAYTARAVCSLISRYGLVSPGNAALVPYAIDLLWGIHEAKGEKRAACFKLADEFKAALSTGECHPRFLGVWDTVSSVGWIANPLALPDTAALPGIQTIRHAVSIDERRAFFRTNLVVRDPARDVREVWFAGDHCDVGGGHPEGESGLSKIPLEWMIGEAAHAGMSFDNARVQEILGNPPNTYEPPNAKAPAHDQMWPYWWPAEFIPKKHWDKVTGKRSWHLNLFRRRHYSIAPVIDDSVYERGEDYLRRLPPDAVRRSDDLKKLEGAAQA